MRLDLVVGPNGAGKTTFVRKVLIPALLPGTAFVNADEIAKQTWPDDAEARAYDAAKVADSTRQALIAQGIPFVAETVFSHHSKVDLVSQARRSGFHVALHVLVVPEVLSVRRVEYRVASGGHSVPEAKIRGRYQRLWSNVVEGARMSHETTIYDSSTANGVHTLARLFNGIAVGAGAWPAWAPNELRAAWPATD